MKKLSNAASLLLLAIIFGQVQGQAVEYACAQLPKKRPIYAEKTFFSSSSTDVGTLPKYKLGTKPAEKIRTFIQAGTPELDQVRMIASLRGKQREEVIRVYEKGRAELSVMNVEFSELRKKMPPCTTTSGSTVSQPLSRATRRSIAMSSTSARPSR